MTQQVLFYLSKKIITGKQCFLKSVSVNEPVWNSDTKDGGSLVQDNGNGVGEQWINLGHWRVIEGKEHSNEDSQVVASLGNKGMEVSVIERKQQRRHESLEESHEFNFRQVEFVKCPREDTQCAIAVQG